MNALRLSLGTLTVLPVGHPSRVDRRVAGRAMLLAPLVGLLLAVPAGAVLWLVSRAASPLLASTLTVGLLALLTRGLHLDGLADTADGLGTRRPAAEALEVMRRSDVGPFGVVTLLLVLLAQVAALASLDTGRSVPGLAAALVVSRAALPLLCLRGVPAARTDGLGAVVAGSVAPWAAGVATVAVPVLVAAIGWSSYGAGVVVVLGGAVVGAVYARHCVRRLGGVTGDVLGAVVEVTFTAALVMLAFV